MTENTTYGARYHVQHGVTHGFGIVYDDEHEEKCEFQAEDVAKAVMKAIEEARGFAKRFIAAPSGNTTVVLRELYEKGGSIIDVFSVVRDQCCASPGSFDAVKDRMFPDGTHYTAQCSWLEHVLELEKTQEMRKKQGQG